MIILRAYRVMVSPKGNMKLLGNHILKKWENDYDFGFNIFKPVNWLIFLKEYKNKKGKLLSFHTSENEEIAYEVYVWGVPSWMKDYFFKTGVNDGYHCLFPGYEKGRKMKIAIYGVLQRSKPIRNYEGKLVIKTVWKTPLE